MAKQKPRVPEEELARLYGAPREEFVAERNALAKRLRSDGERALADQVRRLKKPSVPAWAVNRAVRADPPAAKRLLDAGARLRDAQEAALGGRGREELRKAIAGEQSAVEGMVDAVQRAAGGAGALSPAILERATETLRAVARDDELREEFAAGHVERDRKAVGFGGALEAMPARAAPAKPKRSAAERRKAQQRVRSVERSLQGAVKRVTEARRSLERAERGVEKARAKLERAESQRSERETELEDARAALGEHEG